jgi:hypothetical protein
MGDNILMYLSFPKRVKFIQAKHLFLKKLRIGIFVFSGGLVLYLKGI